MLWGHSSADTEPPQHLLAWGDPCGFCKSKRDGGTPPGVGKPRAAVLVARGGLCRGCSRWRGGQGTRVPVSQLCPNHQLPHSSCCSVRVPSPALSWGGGLSPVSSRCPSSPGPACPQLPGGMTLCPPAGPRSAGSHRPSRQRGSGRAGHGRERAGTGTGPWQGRG